MLSESLTVNDQEPCAILKFHGIGYEIIIAGFHFGSPLNITNTRAW